ncbi:glycosyltransferase family 57 protein [Thamnocephalis sphaerospora]|uniref:Alpha-1,3-glucosyltransferase n=1 Tax=Thamnocephalis sphaerospora TaxID=78915 RepID=A0A4P9XUN1_9FUNG|nr:glycosyltransferase family 57 protein [Thamnocephalis sphaerospora]|eukprot:RKP09944.1 glycosyltransferase family 57 protein [Thamnocephalis sphaerospora]
MADAFWRLAVIGTLGKLLLVPSYRSTDFDVHRNWLAITRSLPVSRWYYEDTSEWTLDYPPFFAWFEYVLSLVAPWVDPLITVISAEPYQSLRCILYQRFTVILTDGMLYYALYRFVKEVGWQTTRERVAVAACIFLNFGLVLIDHILWLHIHFQYNGFLFGILIMSIVEVIKGRAIHAAAWFAILLNFKHIFLYLAPAYFVYLLRAYCFPRSLNPEALRRGMPRLASLGAVVLGITAISFGPFLVRGQLGQVLSRLFPFKRGLCHAFWAPNFWALYSFADRILLTVYKVVLRRDVAAPASMTRGLVGDTTFGILPDIPPLYTFLLTLLFQLPALVKLFRKPTARNFIDALILCGYASFLFGWHVHEKAVLLMVIPLVAAESLERFRIFALLSAAGHVSLLPLLFTSAEGPTKVALIALWSVLTYGVLGHYARGHKTSEPLFGRPLQLYLAGLCAVQTYAGLGHQLLFGSERMEFLPLMILSVYCALGVVVSWIQLYVVFMRPASGQVATKTSGHTS